MIGYASAARAAGTGHVKLALAMIVLIAITVVTALPDRGAAAAASAGGGTMPAIVAPEQAQVDDHDDSRVGVQLAVLAGAVITVVGVGSAGYLLRKRLGRVPPHPEQPAGGRH